MDRVHPFALARRQAADGFAYGLTLDGEWRGRWLRLVYEASRLAPAIRPILRLVLADGTHEDAVLPGPALGRGHFLGFVPDGTREILLALDADAVEGGRWRLARVSTRSTPTLVAEGLWRRPERTAQALYFRARGDRRRFRNALRVALATAPVARYVRFAAPRRRPLSAALDGTPRGGDLRILIVCAPGPRAAATEGSLGAQSHGAWDLARAEGALDPAALCAAHGADALGVLAPGDTLDPDALAILADRLAATGAALVYCDEEVWEGRTLRPRLKPAWSPDLARASGVFPGRLALYSRAFLEEAGLGPAGTPEALEAALAGAAADRLDLLVQRVTQPLCRRAEAVVAARSPVVRSLPEPPLVSIVMPSRDRLDLVARSVGDVLDATDYPALELVLVDNGSTDPAVRDFYAGRAADPRFRVLDRPGPFNFSGLVNDGVAQARGAVVVLLNNDVAVLHPEWLTRLVSQAVRPEIGAVGAKLLYADGRLQHAGVVVGLGGYAGHILRRRPGTATGHLGRLAVAHERSAVTAACLAVGRDKFLAVGGLDAQSFPVDFNDVDLCLRLAAHGWRTLLEPAARLSHLESVSRGPPQGAERLRFEAERARFADRWRAVIRDDPFFHPALSLTTFGEDLE